MRLILEFLMSKLQQRITALLISSLIFVPVALAQSNDSSASSAKPSPSVTAADAKFMKEAAAGGRAEVQLGQLAQQKAASDQVKQFGQRMVTDHSKANEQLEQIAQQTNVRLPQGPDAKERAEKARLEKLSGDQFDQAYMSHMVADHKKDVSEFQKESSAGRDPEVKNFASQTLPTLQDHLKQAESIAPAK
jgi:putative membrane protein